MTVTKDQRVLYNSGFYRGVYFMLTIKWEPDLFLLIKNNYLIDRASPRQACYIKS